MLRCARPVRNKISNRARNNAQMAVFEQPHKNLTLEETNVRILLDKLKQTWELEMNSRLMILVLVIFSNVFNPVYSQQITFERAWPESLIGQYINVRTLAINNSGHIFAGTIGYYVWRSTNNGASWRQLRTGFTWSEIFSLAINDFGHIFAGTFIAMFRSKNNGNSWQRLTNGLPSQSWFFAVGISRTSGSIFAAGSRDHGIFRSDNNGNNWITINNGLPLPISIVSIIVKEDGSIFLGTGNGVFRSNNNGDSWESASNGLGGRRAPLLARNRGDTLFAITSDRSFFRSINGGNSWEMSQNIGLPATFMRAIAVNSIGHIFLGGLLSEGGGVYRSRNNGDNWEALGLNDYDIQSFVLNDSGQIFVGSHDGVWRSVRSTITSVEQIDRTVPKNFSLEQNYPNPFNPATSIKYQVASRTYVKLAVYNMLGQEVAVLAEGEKSPGTYTVRLDASALSSGVYFYRLTAGSLSEVRKMILLK